MRLNYVEKALMINPIRALAQRHFEARMLKKLGGTLKGGRVLEIGCGRGYGTCIISEDFNADQVHAFDIDPHMVQLAGSTACRRSLAPTLWVGDTLHIAARSNVYDAVFDFGAIHHVLPWRDSLAEVYRVLKPGGRFYVEEILEKYIVHPLFRRLLDHPQQDRFNRSQFIQALEQNGFDLIASSEFLQLFAWFVADKPRMAAA
jgi:ubiquinone/menaquinone biosynthesis C-methylase UbiE